MYLFLLFVNNTNGEIYEEKMHVDNEKARFSPQKEVVKNTFLDIQETGHSPSPQPVEIPITKVELLSEPPIPLPIVILPPNKPIIAEKITEPKNIPIISIDEIKEKIANDPLYNAILLFITKFMYSEEAMDNLKLILKENIYDILVQIKNKSYARTNLNLILYSIDSNIAFIFFSSSSSFTFFLISFNVFFYCVVG